MTRKEKSVVREYVASLYARRNGRNIRITRDGAVHVTVDGDGSQMSRGRDMSGGVLFAGWADDLLRQAEI